MTFPQTRTSPEVSNSSSHRRFCQRLMPYFAAVIFVSRIDFVYDLKIRNCISMKSLTGTALRIAAHSRSNCSCVVITKSFLRARGLVGRAFVYSDIPHRHAASS